jgi:hypothetical protein
MSEWIDQFENHQVHDDIRSALAPAEEIRSTAEELPADAVERIDRIVNVLTEVQRRLQRTDPNLIPIQPLSNLNGPLSQITSQLSSFQSNKNAAHIQNAHNRLENVLVHLAQIPMPSSPDDMDAIREAAIALRRSAGQHIRHVEEEGRTAQRELQKLKQGVESLKQLTDQRIEQVQALVEAQGQAFSTAEESREQRFTRVQDEQKEAASALLAEKQEEWTAVVEGKQAEYEELYESIHEKIESLETEFKKGTQAILDDMQERKTEAEKVVGVITDTGMVGGYQRIANSEKRAAVFWRTIAFLSLCILVGFAIALFFVTLKDTFKVTPTLTLTRGFVAVAVAILAGYAARQADKHERAQRRHRKMELELASIAPFLHEFPEDEARKIKTELAMKMFAQQESEGPKESKKTTNSVIGLAEMAMESLQSLIGKQ